MSNYDNICMGCMREIGDEKQCPHCGFHNDSPQLPPYLPMRTIVSERYLIGKLLEYNGDGATYMAWDIERKVPVTIREFLPDTIATRDYSSPELQVMAGCEISFRDCYQCFLEMWRKLARMRGLSALIVVIDIVEDYGTAYAVCEYMDGISLREYLLQSKTGYLSWEDARALFMPVLSTLATLHSAGIIHRGISPTTLIVGKDKKLRISGFSIWQARTSRGDLHSQLFSGYSAIEQYGFEGQQGPWTDIYAFAAVLYRTLIGSTPPEATSRVTNDKMMIPAKFAEQLPAYVINALVNALQILPEDRTRNVEQLRAELSASPTVAVASTKLPEIRKENEPKVKKNTQNTKLKKSNPLKVGLITAGIVIALGLLIFTIIYVTVLKDKYGNTTDNDANTSTSQEALAKVPDLVGRTYSTVSIDRTISKNFTLDKSEEFNDTIKEGYIISQSIDPGTKVAIGTQIKVVVSKGIEQIVFPKNVVGMDYNQANQMLTSLGFKCEKIDKINSTGQTNNSVASVNLEEDKEYDKGTKVILQVWTDSGTTKSDSAFATDTLDE